MSTPLRDAEILKIESGSALLNHVPSEQLVEVPLTGGRDPLQRHRQELVQVIKPRVEEILALARAQVAGSGYEGKLSAGIVITGGSARMDGIIPLACSVFDAPVRLGVPLRIAGVSNGSAALASDPGWPRQWA